MVIGISVLLLDLDVGFLQSPQLLYDGYYTHLYTPPSHSHSLSHCRFFDDPLEQLRAQMDVGSCMNKSAGNTWFTQPLTNFGLFLVKPHEYSIKVRVLGSVINWIWCLTCVLYRRSSRQTRSTSEVYALVTLVTVIVDVHVYI